MRKEYMPMFCRETKLKTLNTEPVIVRVEYAELKKNFLYQELQDRNLFMA